LRQNSAGTILSKDPVSPIAAIHELVAIGCSISWSLQGLTVTHPRKGKLSLFTSSGCPEVEEGLALELIKEIEGRKARHARLRSLCEASLEETEEALRDRALDTIESDDLEPTLRWLTKLYPGVPSHIMSQVPVAAREDGETLPWSRRQRRAFKNAKGVVLHLFCGKSRGTLKDALPSGFEVIEVDVQENILSEAVAAFLVLLASTGKLRAIFGGPPCRTWSACRHNDLEDPNAPRPIRDVGAHQC
jgi:hypothetical protein